MRKWIDLVEDVRPKHLEPYTDSRPLFHGTSIPALASILSMNLIHAGNEDDDGQGISLTTSYDRAEGFSYRAYEPYEHEYDDQDETVHDRCGEMAGDSVVIHFDADKLRAHFALVHYSDPGLGGIEEDEVRIMAEEVTNVRDYITKVDVGDDEIDWWLTYAETTKDKELFEQVSLLRSLYA